MTDAFAGVERYVCQVANGLTARGHRVEVVGGAPVRMTAELDRSFVHHPASSVIGGALALAGSRGADIVHAHMTAAEGSAYLAHPVDRAPIVATRHFAAERGSSALNRTLARVTVRPVVAEVAISEFVARSVAAPTTLIPNAVADRPQAVLEATRVVMLQRLDDEKAPDVGLRAWARSGLASRGWHLVVAGTGILRPELERLADELGCSASVTFAGLVADTDGLLAGGGAHTETVGDAGLLFPPGDVDAAARELVRLADDPKLRRSVGRALRSRQQERYSLALHLDRLEALYASVAAAHPVGHARDQARATTRS